MILILFLSLEVIIGIAVGSAAILIVAFLLLYIFVISKQTYKVQAREISKKFSYLDGLLIGQDSQYIHRLEVISRTNLLYIDKYEFFSKRYKTVLDNYDKFAESMIKQLNNYISAKQYRNIKKVIADTKAAIDNLEVEVTQLDRDLYSIIKIEENARQNVLQLKENFRMVKQSYLNHASELEIISNSFNKIFEKLESCFRKIDESIETAEYDEANAYLPTVTNVIEALNSSLQELPNLCSLIHTVIPNKIKEFYSFYKNVEEQGVPVYHLNVKVKEEEWRKRTNDLFKTINNLQTSGVHEKCSQILNEISDYYSLLNKEIEDEQDFKRTSSEVYKNVLNLEHDFLRITSILPDVKKYYLIDENHNCSIEKLKNDINHLVESRRILDGFIHSGTKQPYSLLKDKLFELEENYKICQNEMKEFKSYIDSLKTSIEEAYGMIFSFYYRLKEIENEIRTINLSSFTNKYSEEINKTYFYIDELYNLFNENPINVALVNEKTENLKSFANSLFNEIDNKYRMKKLAESAVVYANRDRNHQNDVHQRLSQLEIFFENGDFEKVYQEANSIFKRNHVDGSIEKQ